MGSMLRLSRHGFAVLFSVALICGCSPGSGRAATPPQQPATPVQDPPDNTWGGWWPSSQWAKQRPAPEAEALRAARRDWKSVDYPRIETPWGHAFVSFSTLEVKPPHRARRCLRFDLVFSGPGTVDDQAWKNHPVPEAGAVRAEIISQGKVVRAATNGEAKIAGWAGGSLGTSGDMIIEFDWLPDDLEDYWVRVRIRERTVWFLIPYGLGCDPTTPIRSIAGRSGAPAPPEGRGEKDQIVPWSHVDFDLGWLDASGKVRTDKPEELSDVWKWMKDKKHITIRVSNPFDGACVLTLYKETHDAWSLVSPRTSVAIGIPEARVLFSTLDSVRREEGHMRRNDTFRFWRQPSETRTWGLLKVTVEESVFEKAVPGSLFLYIHGAPR